MAQVQEDQAQLPPKLANQNRIPSQNQVRVLLNGFNMDVRQAVPEVCQFKLTFLGERTVQREGQPDEVVVTELARGVRNDEAKETRRRLLWRLFLTLLEANPDIFGRNRQEFVYDCGDTLFCARDLSFPIGETRDFVVNVDRNALEQRCRTYIRNRQRILATLQRTGTVNLRNAYNDVVEGDSTVNRFLELLTTQKLLDQERHYIFGNRMYESESVIMLEEDPHILKNGMQKNVRFVGDNAANAHPIVQIDPKKSAFYPAIELLYYLCYFFNLGEGPEGAREFQARIDEFFDRANRRVKGLVVQSTHLEAERQIPFTAYGLTNMPANRLEFDRDGQMVTVANYFRDEYMYNLRYPNLPCVIHQLTQLRQSYYPLELVMIVQGQRVSIDKQTSKLTEEMIKQCQIVPANMPGQIEEQRAQAMVQSGNPYFKAFKVRCEPDQILTDASVLYQPAIQYQDRNDRVEPPLQQNWKTTGRGVPNYRQYAAPAKFPKTWAFVIVQRCVADEEAGQFVKEFIRHAHSRGLTEAGDQSQVDHYDDLSMEKISNRFRVYTRNNCMFVIFIAPGKKRAYPGDIHHVMKKMEQEHSVLTQHISPEIMRKAAGLLKGPPGGAIMVLENILMKTNLKLGGANYNLVTSATFKQAVRNPADPVADEWLRGGRMFIGIDFSHAPPQNLFEREKRVAVGIPTCVGMAYTIGKMMLRMRGTYWIQTPRQTTMSEGHVRPFIENIKKALMVFEGQNSKYPEHLIIYRGGASEGEFKRICAWEGFAFERAFEELAARGVSNFRPPAVTIVVCQRQSNYRNIPQHVNPNARPPDQNVQPGTVVDKNVMSPALTEFLLTPHRALQGTAQPVRCTVVYEHRPEWLAQRIPRMPVEEIENITNTLCYSHGNFAGSTALPGVLYSAGDLAKRGKNNWKIYTTDGEQVQHFELPELGLDPDQQAAAQQQLNEQRATYYAQLSTQLEPHIDSKFWA